MVDDDEQPAAARRRRKRVAEIDPAPHNTDDTEPHPDRSAATRTAQRRRDAVRAHRCTLTERRLERVRARPTREVGTHRVVMCGALSSMRGASGRAPAVRTDRGGPCLARAVDAPIAEITPSGDCSSKHSLSEGPCGRHQAGRSRTRDRAIAGRCARTEARVDVDGPVARSRGVAAVVVRSTSDLRKRCRRARGVIAAPRSGRRGRPRRRGGRRAAVATGR